MFLPICIISSPFPLLCSPAYSSCPWPGPWWEASSSASLLKAVGTLSPSVTGDAVALEGWAGRLVLVGWIGQKQVRLECALLMGTVCISCLSGFLSSGRVNICITLIVVRCTVLSSIV